MVSWDSRLPGVVGSGAKALEDELGLRTVGDLLRHYPRRHLDRTTVGSLAELVPGELALVVVDVATADVKPYQDRRTGQTAYRVVVRAELADDTVWLTFFDRRKHVAEWRVTKPLRPGNRVLVSGKFVRKAFNGQLRWELAHPEVDEDDLDRTGLKPLYPARGKLTSLKIEKAVRTAVDVMPAVPDPVPDAVRRELDLVTEETALRWFHAPEDWAQRGAALKRLKFTEAFVAQAALAQRRHRHRHVQARPRAGRAGGLLDAFEERMPFTLTAGQQEVEAEIVADLGRPHPMQRLLQGEVGSGKTVVALRAMLRVVDSGAQAALLAPTEVLAQQHHRSITRMLGDLAAGGMLGGHPDATRVELLTGSLPAAARRQALGLAASGEAGILVGTHALLQQGVDFADLALVVVDEQHRFGVEQRAALAAKAGGASAGSGPAAPPHELVMTATPIPRTVAMTVFGDLETSALTELPAGRAPIQTTVVAVREQPAWLDRAWDRVREEVAQGRQVYVVCPRISADAARDDGEDQPDEPEDPTDVEGEGPESSGARSRPPAPPMAAVEEVAPRLAGGALAGLRVAALHGRMSADDKDATMSAFAAGGIDVLVATTVIEVGVDVGNATTMVVLDADRFGLSQLHQLRGRVGRGGHPGLCLLVTTSEAGSPARDRLDAVAATTDGFVLAERDLELRREGDVLGSNQSGHHRSLRLLSVARDAALITTSREAATALVEADPDLAGAEELRSAVLGLEIDDQAAFLEKS
ncbi:ATP-dependent DNA helicase RecG [Nocardioides sp. HDW12B]|uniref:ATP-dependent DNA helicase RecG n=1 Tax=Nocardioides sp. HDW12B TaxID=2714939 RepID=UPI00140DDC5B|nr:ATP-dependent DNA helicase RecG [Nocardioides sp. HDW12B]QIK67002.1 ATP-dependent DNA helicase RecG [Nocardioides sp. HDW12B]